MARRSGGDDIVNKRAIIAALGDCRGALTREMPNMKPTGALYHIVAACWRRLTRWRPS